MGVIVDIRVSIVLDTFTQKRELPCLLAAPLDYFEASQAEIEQHTNGMGPAGYGWLVPDWFCGLKMTPAANIHDWMYKFGQTLDDKSQADRMFANNMARMIATASEHSWKWVTRRRLARARLYQRMVEKHGGGAFWAGKND